MKFISRLQCTAKRECIALYALPLLGLLRSVSTVFGINTEFSKIVIAVVLDHF